MGGREKESEQYITHAVCVPAMRTPRTQLATDWTHKPLLESTSWLILLSHALFISTLCVGEGGISLDGQEVTPQMDII